jgi:hypothetical protein
MVTTVLGSELEVAAMREIDSSRPGRQGLAENEVELSPTHDMAESGEATSVATRGDVGAVVVTSEYNGLNMGVGGGEDPTTGQTNREIRSANNRGT